MWSYAWRGNRTKEGFFVIIEKRWAFLEQFLSRDRCLKINKKI